MHERTPDGWEQLAQQIRTFCLRNFGDEAVSVEFRLRHLGRAELPVPLWGALEVRPRAAEPAPARFAHTSDFQRVDWGGRRYLLTPKQARVVSVLWAAWEDGLHEVAQAELLAAAESDCVRLVDLFRRSDAWGSLVVSTRPGYYRLAELAEPVSAE